MSMEARADTLTDELVDAAALRATLAADDGTTLQNFRNALSNANVKLRDRFESNVPVDKLVRQLAQAVDEVILAAWEHFVSRQAKEVALVAVGGYGRGELHPHSDIDLMVLLNEAGDGSIDEPVSRFLTFLWDIGLEVGHSVRSLGDCEEHASDDVTIVTTIMESRLLAGPHELFGELER